MRKLLLGVCCSFVVASAWAQQAPKPPAVPPPPAVQPFVPPALSRGVTFTPFRPPAPAPLAPNDAVQRRSEEIRQQVQDAVQGVQQSGDALKDAMPRNVPALGDAADQTVEQCLDGAFIQFDNSNKFLSAEQWRRMLDRMRAAKCSIIILQYLEKRDKHSAATAERYVPQRYGDPDPVAVILDYADKNQMAVFIGLRLDPRLEGSMFLNNPAQLREGLKEELPKNIALAREITARYGLNARRSFAGWYLPVEVANYTENFTGESSWVSQLNQFSKVLVTECKRLVNRPVAVSPYFNATKEAWLTSAKEFGEACTRLLKGSGVSIVMLQDGVGARNIPASRIHGWVAPFRDSIALACKEASTPAQPIEFWLNVESIGADINRLHKQMKMGKGHAKRLVTFDFPHHLNQPNLYDAYLKLISER